MFPIRDNIPAQKAPLVTTGLIALNGAIFLMSAMMPERALERFFFFYGFIPAKLLHPELVRQYYFHQFHVIVPAHYTLSESLLPMFSCLFLHGGWLHVIGNMWFLWIFGDNVEDCFGHFGFLLFYLACGLASSVAHAVTASTSPVPTVGASGAIAGVMGAYMVLYPRARVLTLVPWIIFFFAEFPAFMFLFFWFIFQFFSGMASLGAGPILTGGVAWWAHIGGFLIGAGFVLVMGIRPVRRPPRHYPRARYTFEPPPLRRSGRPRFPSDRF